MFVVSTHSRPKATVLGCHRRSRNLGFQHTAARRRLLGVGVEDADFFSFNTQPPEGD